MADINRDQNNNENRQNFQQNNPYSTNRPNGQNQNQAGGQPPYSNNGGYPNNNNQRNPQQQNDDDLKKLSERLSKDDKGDKAESFFGFLKRLAIVIVVVILIGAIGVAIFFFTKNKGSVSSGEQIELSIQVSENLENISPDQPTLKTAEIYPGDKYSIGCTIRNASDMKGDDGTFIAKGSIFVRYSISLEIDGQVYHNLILPTISDLVKDSWHVYNPEEEDSEYVWDGYYYYYGALIYNEALTLFNEIEFCFDNVVNSFGGKTGKMTVTVQAVHADETVLGVEKGDAWNTAPRRWITNMQKHQDNKGNLLTF